MSDLAAMRVDLRDCIPRDNDEAQLLEYAQTLLAEAHRLTAENARLRGCIQSVLVHWDDGKLTATEALLEIRSPLEEAKADG